MKNWFHNHRIRKQRSEATLATGMYPSIGLNASSPPTRPLPAVPTQMEAAARIVESKTSSRMSIERYLSAPLEDEPASVPAIDAALKRQAPRSQIPRPVAVSRTNHSRESSFDAYSEGRRTFNTSGSAQESTRTSYSIASKAQQHHDNSPAVPELPRITPLILEDGATKSPQRPTTSGTVGTIDMGKTWAVQLDRIIPGYSPNLAIDYRVKAEEEVAEIQRKAKELEEQIRNYRAQKQLSVSPPPRVTDEMAYARMAAHPKLAWILGADVSDGRSITRPKSSGSAAASTTDDIPDPHTTTATASISAPSKSPRRSKSSSAIDDRARQAVMEKRSAGIFQRKASKRPKFFCTFCQKRFHSKTEWIRHERTIHMPEELWICCPRTGEFPERCPFCAKSNPSSSHLADHDYLYCQEKPLSERTFSRKDHFLQHISQEHRVSPGQKPLRLTELLEAWRHPLPLREGHQALHCGFCGLTFPTYKERTGHVSSHFMEGLDMMSWWDARVSHDVPAKPVNDAVQNPNLTHKCTFCERAYENLTVAQKLHPICTMWSCSFLQGMQYTIYPAGSRTSLEALCCYCNDTLVKGAGKVKGSILKEHINQHNFRNCNQRLYFSGQRFRQHLQDNHKTTYDGTLFAGWSLLVKSCKKEKPAVFEQLDPASIPRRAYTDPGASETKFANKHNDEPSSMPRMNFMDLSETPQRTTAPRKKLRRKPSTQTLPEKAGREVRDSEHFFGRAATFDVAYGPTAPPSPHFEAHALRSPQDLRRHHKPGFPVSSLPVDAVNHCPKFYRRRLDASTRNRLYVREQDDGILSKNSQRLFRKVPGSTFGGLILHSSMVGATPARMTNCVDIYTLH